NIMQDSMDNQIQPTLHISYFEGDFWTNIIEEKLDQEEED
ncbi:unnamed protein product, partial [Rotaria sp. Silwood1]